MRHTFVISVICSSLIFFYYYLQLLVFMLMEIANMSTGTVFVGAGVIILLFIGIASLTGSVCALYEQKKRSKQWYYGIPFVISLFIFWVLSFLSVVQGKAIVDYFLVQVLAAITSLGFFLSFPDPARKTTRFFALLSGVISIGLICSILAFVPDLVHLSRSEAYIFILLFSWLFVLPLIGACFIVTAFLVREKGSPSLQT